MNTDAPAWPLIVVHSGDDELTFVNDEAQWLADASLSAYPHDADDFAIDSRGRIFNLGFAAGKVKLATAGEAIGHERFSQLVRSHLAAMNECCVSKTHDYTYELGFDLVKKTADAQ